MFKSVRPDRISQAIVDQIKEAIFQKKIKTGDKLPSERQMMEQFQTSRVTVREALKTLEHSGILEIKRGTQGGAFVRDPDVKFVNNFLQDMFSMGNIKVFDLTEARMAVEPFSVKIATRADRRGVSGTDQAEYPRDRRVSEKQQSDRCANSDPRVSPAHRPGVEEPGHLLPGGFDHGYHGE